MENFLTRQKAQAILDSRPDGVDIPTALKELSNQGFTIEGYNDKPVQSALSNVAGVAKSTLGGIASGVGGIALTGIDAASRGLVNKFGTDQMKTNLANSPTLNEQFKAQMGGNENPTAFGVGQLAGEVATLAAPVGAIGKVAKVGSEALGAGAKTSKLIQAGTEGAAFTAGIGLTENKPMSFEDYAINTGLNIALPGAGMVAKSVGENMPARIINSLVKPLQKDFAYGKNPGKSVAELVQPANDFDGLIANIKTTLNDVGSRIGSVVSQSPNLAQIDLSYTLKPIDDAIAKASQAKGTNSTLIQRLQTVKQDLVGNINNGINPQEYKGLVGDLTKWTGNVSDDAMVNKSLKQVYGTTKQSMDDVLSKELTPEQFAQYKADSEAYGNLLSAKNAAEHRDKLVQRQDLISFGAKNSAMLAGLTTAVASGGAGVPAIIAGIAGAGIDKALASPAFKTRMARLLSKLAPKEVTTFFDKVPTAKSLFTEQELKQFGSELKKNSSGQMTRGMINLNPSSWFEEVGNNAEVGLKAKTKELQLDMAKEAARTMRNNGVSVEVPTSKNAVQILEQAKELARKKKVSDIIKAETPTSGMNKVLEDRTKKTVSSPEQEAKKYKTLEEFVKAQTEKLPLEAKKVENTQFSFVKLPKEIRGNEIGYAEKVYESNIKSGLGGQHYSKLDYPNYFAHSRVDNIGDTRRILEIQSDLMQSGKYKAGDLSSKIEDINKEIVSNGKSYRVLNFERVGNDIKFDVIIDGDRLVEGASLSKAKGGLKSGIESEISKIEDAKKGTIATKLKPFEKNWYEGIIGKEVEQAIKDNKSIILFPTGETSGKIQQFKLSESGKQNAVKDFYDSKVGDFVSKKFGAKKIVDGNGVSWYKVDLSQLTDIWNKANKK